MSRRHAWEATGDETFKQQLLAYNQEDSLALQRVVETIRCLGGDGPPGDGVAAAGLGGRSATPLPAGTNRSRFGPPVGQWKGAAAPQLARQLSSKHNVVAAKAGQIIGEWKLASLERDLIGAFDRFMRPGADRCAVLLQQGQAGPIVGAALLRQC